MPNRRSGLALWRSSQLFFASQPQDRAKMLDRCLQQQGLARTLDKPERGNDP